MKSKPTDSPQDLPLYSDDLIDKLDMAYPHKCPTAKMSPWDIAFYAGKRDLIDTLLAHRQASPRR